MFNYSKYGTRSKIGDNRLHTWLIPAHSRACVFRSSVYYLHIIWPLNLESQAYV
jgi:hypothetical protein